MVLTTTCPTRKGYYNSTNQLLATTLVTYTVSQGLSESRGKLIGVSKQTHKV